ncbi:hypothetical protein CJ179_01510 [Rhodococcus sp. ACS1]|uniref:Muconolactone delta-isomerase n=1 Tax=Rhodococcus jostii TaxID=132919 RepID=A0A1H4ILK0_RHOJO|nr:MULTISPECIES: hypothetical protein [Rhodococcus]PBC52103.1 hypothetical protein CJ179_01510 [Rhodococcus sp. ACS1]SEB34735.1 Muconolactone delta-isomerase [Rhodococcus jostii]
MKFVVIATPVPSVDRTPLQAEETRAVQSLHSRGVIERVYSRVDGAQSYTFVEAESAAAARAEIEHLPFYIAGAMTVEIHEVRHVL